jgi:hypothetical protein
VTESVCPEWQLHQTMVIGQTWLVATHCPAKWLEATQFFGQVMSPSHYPNSLLPKRGGKWKFVTIMYATRRELWVAYALHESSMRLIIKSLLVELPHGFNLRSIHLCTYVALGGHSTQDYYFQLRVLCFWIHIHNLALVYNLVTIHLT